MLGVPMFGLEAAFAKVAERVHKRVSARMWTLTVKEEETVVDAVTEDIARRMMQHERKLDMLLDGEM